MARHTSRPLVSIAAIVGAVIFGGYAVALVTPADVAGTPVAGSPTPCVWQAEAWAAIPCHYAGAGTNGTQLDLIILQQPTSHPVADSILEPPSNN